METHARNDRPEPSARGKKRRWMFEGKSEPLLPARRFAARLLWSVALAALLVAAALSIGIFGYREFARFSWVDALLNASMILSGMGPVGELPTDTAKIFASVYALFSGVAFITSIGVIAAPVVHRFLHRFHLEDGGN